MDHRVDHAWTDEVHHDHRFAHMESGTSCALSAATMKTRSLLRLTRILPVIFATACIEEIDAPEESQVEAELSTADWGLNVGQAGTSYGAQVATVNGTTYMVHSDIRTKAMYWKKRTGPRQWTLGQLIPGQKTSDQVSLAAFNGYLYMLHVGETDTSAVWWSRFDPITETWTENKKLPLATDVGAPAIAAFDGRLWIVGGWAIDQFDHNQIWVATMTPDGVVGGPVTLKGRITGHRPSLAVFTGKLFMSFDNKNSNYTMTHTAGSLATSWSSPRYVSSGPQGTAASAWDARMAVAGGYLHLVHTRPGQPLDTYWTYWNQCTWAPEVRLPDGRMNRPPSLTDGGPGLILTRETLEGTDIGSGIDWYRVNVTEYTAPPPPLGLPQCGGAVGF